MEGVGARAPRDWSPPSASTGGHCSLPDPLHCCCWHLRAVPAQRSPLPTPPPPATVCTWSPLAANAAAYKWCPPSLRSNQSFMGLALKTFIYVDIVFAVLSSSEVTKVTLKH